MSDSEIALGEAPDPALVLRERVRIVLVRPLQPGNVGSVARAMANMGLRRLVIVDPPAFDLERARWMAAGGAALLDQAQFVGSVAQAVAGCALALGTTARVRRWAWPVISPRTLAQRCQSTVSSTSETVEAPVSIEPYNTPLRYHCADPPPLAPPVALQVTT